MNKAEIVDEREKVTARFGARSALGVVEIYDNHDEAILTLMPEQAEKLEKDLKAIAMAPKLTDLEAQLAGRLIMNGGLTASDADRLVREVVSEAKKRGN